MNTLDKAAGKWLPRLSRWKDAIVIVTLLGSGLANVFCLRSAENAWAEANFLSAQNATLRAQLLQARQAQLVLPPVEHVRSTP